MHSGVPNGFFSDDLIWYGGLGKGCQIAKGFEIQTADLRNASIDSRMTARGALQILLSSLAEHQKAQFHWSVDSDYRSALKRYDSETDNYVATEKAAGRIPNVWLERSRRERHSRYYQDMKDRRLRRERLHMFVTQTLQTPSTIMTSRKGLQEKYGKIAGQIQNELKEYHNLYQTILGSSTTVTPMTDLDHFSFFMRLLNPSYADQKDPVPLSDLFFPEYSIQELCWHSGYVPMPENPAGFYMDGYYHAMFVIKRWPRNTEPGLMFRLTGLPFLDYSITLTVAPLEQSKVVRKTEEQLGRNRGDFQATKAYNLISSAKKLESKIDRLSQGYTFPFDAQVTIRVWAKTPEELDGKCNAIKNQVNKMNGAQTQELSLPTQTKKLFFGTWPGWQGTYNNFHLYAESNYLADLIPYSSTFTGYIDTAEALYDGGNGNLVGVTTFKSGTPQHGVLLGMTGSGKSVTICDLLSQTGIYFPFTVIIEEGLSYGIFSKTYSYRDSAGEIQACRPIVIHPDADLTLNIFDTQGSPLNQGHLSIATALISRMVGESSDGDKPSVAEAMFTHYINDLYRDRYESWAAKNPMLLNEAARLACAVDLFRKTRTATGTTNLEAYAQLRDLIADPSGEGKEFLASIQERDVTKFIKEPDTERRVVDMAFSFFKPHEYPHLSNLQELMRNSTYNKHEKARVHELATLIGQWTVEGAYRLFDGTSNCSITGPIAHFELGYIPEDAKSLKAAAGLLISGYVRQHIITLPRAQRKRIIFEEVARTLNMPGGEKIVSEAYAQLRKFGVWNLAIVQQYDIFKKSRIRSTVFGNSKMFLIMRQQDQHDLRDFAGDVQLPDTAQGAIMDFPLPENQPKGKRYTSLSYHVPSVTPPITGTVRNYVSKEMLYCSSSSGEHFEAREAALKKYPNVTEGIIAESVGSAIH